MKRLGRLFTGGLTLVSVACSGVLSQSVTTPTTTTAIAPVGNPLPSATQMPITGIRRDSAKRTARRCSSAIHLHRRGNAAHQPDVGVGRRDDDRRWRRDPGRVVPHLRVRWCLYADGDSDEC
jgi:hypothetical protein